MNYKKSNARIAFEIINIIIMILVIVTMLFPFLHVLTVSLQPVEDYVKGGFTLIPKRVTLDSYKYIFKNNVISNAYIVTIFVVVVGTAINLFMTCITSYALSKKHLPGRGFFMGMVLIAMYFSSGIVPNYLLIKNLGLIDSIWSLIIPGALNMWYLIIMRNFFEGIPISLEEAADIDGCSQIGILFRIVLPISKASLATIGLFYAVNHWNAFFHCVMYINSAKKWTLQVVLRQIVLDSSTQALLDEVGDAPPLEVVKMASIIATTLPILFVYPFIQKYFVKGVIVGAVKG